MALGGAAAAFALAGWQTAASICRPMPALLAAAVFLWVPGHAWSWPIATGRDRGTGRPSQLVAAAGRRRAAAAVFATSVAAVCATLLLALLLPWPYAAVVLPAAAWLVARARTLRLRADRASARTAFEASTRFLRASLGGLALSAFS